MLIIGAVKRTMDVIKASLVLLVPTILIFIARVLYVESFEKLLVTGPDSIYFEGRQYEMTPYVWDYEQKLTGFYIKGTPGKLETSELDKVGIFYLPEEGAYNRFIFTAVHPYYGYADEGDESHDKLYIQWGQVITSGFTTTTYYSYSVLTAVD
jgi:hypothetical protein